MVLTIKRCESNPIIKKSDIFPSNDRYEVIGVFNPAAIKIGDETVLLLRVAESYKNTDKDIVTALIYNEDNKILEERHFNIHDESNDCSDSRVFIADNQRYLTSISHIRVARSIDGINFSIDTKPTLFASNKYEAFGIEDPRITFIDGKYYIAYASGSELGVNVSLKSTTDFKNFDNLGVIFCSDNKDVVIFPEKINGRYFALHRPSGSAFGRLDIWIAESTDLMYWGNHRHLLASGCNFWSDARVGAGAVPFKTDKGWIEIYHGATTDNRYCLGALLLDLEKPWIVLANSVIPLVEPSLEYETEGFFGNVVFSCGAILEDDIVHIYYGAADDSIGLIDISLDEIYENLGIEVSCLDISFNKLVSIPG